MLKSRPIRGLVLPVSTEDPSINGDGTFSYIDIASINKEEKKIEAPSMVNNREAPCRARQLVKSGDVLVSTVRPNLNAVAAVPIELDGAVASTGFTVLRPDQTSLDSRYLFNWVKSPAFVEKMALLATGASYPAVSDRIIKNSALPLPPLEEQRRIAEVLDKADALRQKRRLALQKLDTLLQSVFLQMFGDPVRNTKGWKAYPLKDLINESRPITYGILKPGDNIDDGVPYIRVVDMKDGEVLVENVKRTTPAISNEYKRSILKAGDLLLSIRGHVGRLAIVPASMDGANITQDTARLAPNEMVEADYLHDCLRSIHFQREMKRFTKGMAVQGINLGDVKQLPIPIPPIALQRKFGSMSSSFRELRKKALAAVEMAEKLFRSLQDRAFKGELFESSMPSVGFEPENAFEQISRA